ncbi:hypothetical protein F4808DRAFT_437520 [Astrocystis sublimbata]|nr:hypothetical protein F4808DRAFT_437520 [Astrocystis sublimbata]
MTSKMGATYQGTQVAVTALVSTPLAILALGLRIWSRRLLRMSLGFNDYMVILAMIFAIGLVGILIAESFLGIIGIRTQDLLATRPWTVTYYAKASIAGEILWAASNTCTKLSILSLYTSILPIQWFSRTCYAAMAVTLAFFISTFLESLLLCQPFQFNWDKTIPNGSCADQKLAYTAAGVINLVIDAFVVALPVPQLYGLQLPLGRRLSIMAMFGLGALICILSLLRIFSVQAWDLDDPTSTGVGISIYSILENTLGVINACLPTIKAALIALFGKGSSCSGTDHKGTSTVQPSQDSRGKDEPYYYRFERLEDEVGVAITHDASNRDTTPERNNITVVREWEVRSQHGRGPHAMEKDKRQNGSH